MIRSSLMFCNQSRWIEELIGGKSTPIEESIDRLGSDNLPYDQQIVSEMKEENAERYVTIINAYLKKKSGGKELTPSQLAIAKIKIISKVIESYPNYRDFCLEVFFKYDKNCIRALCIEDKEATGTGLSEVLSSQFGQDSHLEQCHFAEDPISLSPRTQRAIDSFFRSYLILWQQNPAYIEKISERPIISFEGKKLPSIYDSLSPYQGFPLSQLSMKEAGQDFERKMKFELRGLFNEAALVDFFVQVSFLF